MRLAVIGFVLLGLLLPAVAAARKGPPLRPFALSSTRAWADGGQVAWFDRSGRPVVLDSSTGRRRVLARPFCNQQVPLNFRAGLFLVECVGADRLFSAADGRELAAAPDITRFGRHWVLHGETRWVNWRTGATRGRGESATTWEDPDAPGLVRRVCAPFTRAPLDTGGFTSFEEHGGGWAVRNAAELLRCGRRATRLEQTGCLLETRLLPRMTGCIPFAFATFGDTVHEAIEVWKLPSLRRFTWPFADMPDDARTQVPAFTARWLYVAYDVVPLRWKILRARIPG